MKYKLINNEFFIADRVVLTYNEQKVLNMFLTIKDITMEDLCKATRLNSLFTQQVINSLNKKLNFYFKIDRYTPKGTFEIYYKIKRRR